MLVIEPTKGRWLTDWSEINWTAVEGNVKRLQRRIFRAAKTRQRGLEPRAGRLACVVLRGLGGGNIARLPECAEHVQQLGGESPLPNLMEVKG